MIFWQSLKERKENVKDLIRDYWSTCGGSSKWITQIKESETSSLIRELFQDTASGDEDFLDKCVELLFCCEDFRVENYNLCEDLHRNKLKLNELKFGIPHNHLKVSVMNVKGRWIDGKNLILFCVDEAALSLREGKELNTEFFPTERLKVMIQVDNDKNWVRLNYWKNLEDNVMKFKEDYFEESFDVTGHNFNVNIILKVFLSYNDKISIIMRMIEEIDESLNKQSEDMRRFFDLLEMFQLKYNYKNKVYKSSIKEINSERRKTCVECQIY